MAEALQTVELELTDEQRVALKSAVRKHLTAALESHLKRETRLATYKHAYKAKPESEKKNFPWPGASNVVIPIVGITVDTIVARLMRAFLGTKDLAEVIIKDPTYEKIERDLRDWVSVFFDKSGARDRCRSVFHDMTLDGTAYVKVTWDSKKRLVHAYGSDGGQVTETEVIDYEGPMWHEVPASDLIYPEGFDEWSRLPWIAERLRFTWAELVEARASGMYTFEDEFKTKGAAGRDDIRYRTQQRDAGTSDPGPTDIYNIFELWGKVEIPSVLPDAPPDFREVILTYSLHADELIRAIENPFFGRARHIVRIPFLHQPHEIDGLGAAEQVHQFQLEASTAHNQVIDAATAAIAGIVVVKTGANVASGSEIYPGKQMELDDPRNDINIVHLSMGNSTLPNTEQQAAYWAEKRSGVSSYNMGMESPTVGSQATATATTALISEGNLRFWVSIDDMRDALVDLLYLTLQLEQQCRPEGTPISESRVLMLPQGDLRSVFGLRLMISSEKVNRDLEVQNFQILISVLNDYYARLMQAMGMFLTPGVPEPQKLLAAQVMNAAQNMIKRFVERFDIENIDELVPGIQQALQILGAVNAGGPMAGNPGVPSNVLPGQPSGGPPGGASGARPRGGPRPELVAGSR